MKLPKEGLKITADYYDEDGNLIGTSEDVKAFSFQAIYSPGITQVPAETVNIILNIGITNTGTLPIGYEIPQIFLGIAEYSVTASEGIIEVGQQTIIQSDPIDVSPITGENQIEINIEVYKYPYQTGDPITSETYYWRFSKEELCPCVSPITERFDPILRDAPVYKNHPDTNHWSDIYLHLEQNEAESYIKINAYDINLGKNMCDLKIWMNYYGGSTSEKEVSSYSVSPVSWWESYITWNNKPNGIYVNTIPITPFIYNDITTLITSAEKTTLMEGGSLSWRLTTSATSQWSFGSGESAFPTYLEITYCPI